MSTIKQAKVLLEAGAIREARELLQNIAESDPDDVSACLLLCGISTRTQDWELGVKFFEQLVRIRPNSGLASSGLVQSYLNLGKRKDVLSEIARFQSVAKINNEEIRVVLEEHQRTLEKLN